MAHDYFAGDPRTNHERMVAGDLYIADDPEISRRARRAVALADAYHRAVVADDAGARGLLADLLGTLGEEAFVKPPLYVDYGENIHVGPRTFANYNLTALDVAPITSGRTARSARASSSSRPPTRWSRGRAATSWRRRCRSRSATTSGSAAASSCARA
jgi:hypothetical protein